MTETPRSLGKFTTWSAYEAEQLKWMDQRPLDVLLSILDAVEEKLQDALESGDSTQSKTRSAVEAAVEAHVNLTKIKKQYDLYYSGNSQLKERIIQVVLFLHDNFFEGTELNFNLD